MASSQKPRPWREAPIEAARALRATELCVVAAADKGIYQVYGGDDAHWVNFADSDMPLCDCADFEARGDSVMCKHAVAVLLYRRDARARSGLRKAQADETLARGPKRAKAADVAYASFLTDRGYTGVILPWQLDAAGRWWRPVRNPQGAEEVLSVTFRALGATIGGVTLIPF